MKTKLFCIALIALIAIGFFSSCGNPLMDKALKPLFGPSYKIGDTGPGGGIVFYYDPVGFHVATSDFFCHYLEVASEELVGPYAWGTPGITLIMTVEGMGKGSYNTNTIIDAVGDPQAEAALACFHYPGGGKEDWYLPCKTELEELFDAKDAGKINILFTSTGFWSSSEDTLNNAWYYNITYNSSSDPKVSPKSVIPIRAF